MGFFILLQSITQSNIFQSCEFRTDSTFSEASFGVCVYSTARLKLQTWEISPDGLFIIDE